jgi:hypothetical protein
MQNLIDMVDAVMARDKAIAKKQAARLLAQRIRENAKKAVR